MKKLYLIGIIIVFLMLLIMTLPQVGAICTWMMPIGASSNPVLPLIQIAGLGMILGGLLVLYWKTPKTEEEETEEPSEGLSKKLEEEGEEPEKKEEEKEK